MATLTLKNVPEELLERLKGVARENRRSLNPEALSRLESSLSARHRSAEEKVAALRSLHQRLAHQPPLTDALL
ncbi:MAG TPA: Arc family DNA-binding protein [Thermoanaerobaculia bacterium]|nr:Arc family DNA-binding protein [Thermoanaerobaculia bacterium]